MWQIKEERVKADKLLWLQVIVSNSQNNWTHLDKLACFQNKDY